jgi:23S rRNA (guanine745-N1)-methyltransferase
MLQDQMLSLLRCPVCEGSFTTLSQKSLSCVKKHSFDFSREGYLNLIGHSAFKGDTSEMLEARARLFAAGAFAPLALKIVELCRKNIPHAPAVFLESGAGTSYYLEQLLLSSPEAWGFACDVSKAALKKSARIHARLAAIGADVSQKLPFQDKSIDLLLNIFSPRNLGDFHRLLKDKGLLLVVAPEAEHFQELREALGLLEVAETKIAGLREDLQKHFEVKEELPLRFDLEPELSLVRDLILMGPNAFHQDPQILTPKIEAFLATAKSLAAQVRIFVCSPKN